MKSNKLRGAALAMSGSGLMLIVSASQKSIGFAVGTAGAIAIGLLGSFFGSPIVGCGLITVGIAIANAQHKRCSNTAAWSNKSCRRCLLTQSI